MDQDHGPHHCSATPRFAGKEVFLCHVQDSICLWSMDRAQLCQPQYAGEPATGNMFLGMDRRPAQRGSHDGPESWQVMGFRDPYVIQTGGGGRDWRIVLGSGIAGQGGALLVYASPELTSGAAPCNAVQSRMPNLTSPI